MSEVVDEIIVSALKKKAGKKVVDPSMLGQSTYYDTFERDIDVLDQFEDMAEAAVALALVQSEPAPVAKPTPPAPKLTLVKSQPSTVPELVRRWSRPARIGLRGIGGALVAAAGVGAELARAISQGRLDEAGILATQSTPFRPDTPVQTIEPEPFDEIIVTPEYDLFSSPNLFPEYQDSPVSRADSFDIFEADDLTAGVDIPGGSPEIVPQIQPLADPVLPTVGELSDPAINPTIQPSTNFAQDALLDPYAGQATDPLTNPLADPLTQPLSDPVTFPQNFAMPQALPQPGVGTILSDDFGRAPQTQPQPQPRNCPKCPKCPKPKKKKKKDEARERCYKKFVAERKYERWDKVREWEEIDCLTGRTIR